LLIASSTVEGNATLSVRNARVADVETLQMRRGAAAAEVEEPNENQLIHHPVVRILTSDPPARDAEKAMGVVDVAIDIALILREASEASSVLIPLKVVCTVVAKVLQDTRVSMISSYDASGAEIRNIQERLTAEVNLKSLAGQLEAHYKFIEQEIRGMEIQDRRESQSFPQEQFIGALQTYLK
jgi:hypothetical protein